MNAAALATDNTLTVQNLSVLKDSATLVEDVSFSVPPGQRCGIVGETGSGKSLICRSIVGLAQRRGLTVSGSATLGSVDLLKEHTSGRNSIAGRRIGFVPQSSLSSLNPVMRVDKQLLETVGRYERDDAASRARALELLDQVRMPFPDRVLRSYAHQLSGGMRQRLMIALAIAGRPDVLIADEPTTALDASVQKAILDLIADLCDTEDMSLVLVSHDLGVIKDLCGSTLVMHKGRLAEQGSTEQVFRAPAAAYTRSLMEASHFAAGDRPAPEVQASPALLRLDGVTGGYRPDVPTVHDVSIEVGRAEAVGLVGESGSGKSTLAKMAVGLLTPTSGRVELICDDKGADRRRVAQMIFQDPYASLNPRMRGVDVVAEVHRRWTGANRADSEVAAFELLSRVGLSKSIAERRPRLLSGGECQRVGVARALAAKPQLLVADEPTSALDVSVQAQILDLLEELRSEEGIGILFITHDLEVVRRVTSRSYVLSEGTVVEEGATEQLLTEPSHPYTQKLVAAIPGKHPSGTTRLDVAR